MRFYIDQQQNTDPALNLAVEEYALRHLDISHDYVLLYRNQPCVVVGRHQNVFEEVNPSVLRLPHLPVLRRISGGGTVYHDEGNLNFSFITRYDKSRFNNYQYFNQPIIQALRSLGVQAELNGRNDIVIGEHKISGNAQFTSKDRMVSHGTLLFSARLDHLHHVLDVPSGTITSRAIKSVPGKVVNIKDYLPGSMNIHDFRDVILKNVFAGSYPPATHTFSPPHWEKIQQLAEVKYRQWEWNFGESPTFTRRTKRETPQGEVSAEITVSHGKVVNARFEAPRSLQEEFDRLSRRLSDQRYDYRSLREIVQTLPLNGMEHPDTADPWLDLIF